MQRVSESRTLYLGYGTEGREDHIDEILAVRLIPEILRLAEESPDPIGLLISCEGGDLQYALAIYDALMDVPNEIHAYVYGSCYSGAAIVLQAADLRYMTPNSTLMMHRGESIVAEIGKSKNAWKRIHKELDAIHYRILLERIQEKLPEYTLNTLRRKMSSDWILQPEQALGLGLIDYTGGKYAHINRR